VARIAALAVADRPGLGIAMMLGAYLMFAGIDTSVKWLVLAGLPALQLAFMRYLGHFVISLGLILRNGLDRDTFRAAHMGLVLIRASLLLSSTAINFYVLNFLPLTLTAAIMFSAPIVVCALSPWLLGERVGPWRWTAICIGFAGVLVVVRPFDAAMHWTAVLVCYNAVALALYSIISRRLAGIVSAEAMQFYTGALGSITLLPAAIWTWTAPVTTLDWTLMVVIGAFGWAGHELLTRAHTYAPANTLMPYTYSFMVYLAITSFLIWGQIPDMATLAGAAIIVASGLMIWHRERQRITA
jgi:drug/metabolite transporter (DMT)-like permease